MYTEEEVKKAILSKFYTLKDCAKKLGIGPATLSVMVKKPSLRTTDRLRRIGVIFPDDKESTIVKNRFIQVMSESESEEFIDQRDSEIFLEITRNILELQDRFIFLKKKYKNLVNVLNDDKQRDIP
jgi:hypothetical protein